MWSRDQIAHWSLVTWKGERLEASSLLMDLARGVLRLVPGLAAARGPGLGLSRTIARVEPGVTCHDPAAVPRVT